MQKQADMQHHARLHRLALRHMPRHHFRDIPEHRLLYNVLSSTPEAIDLHQLLPFPLPLARHPLGRSKAIESVLAA